MDRRILKYLAVAYGWSWAFWVAGWLISLTHGHILSAGGTIFDLFGPFPTPVPRADGTIVAADAWTVRIGQILFALAVYGPALGWLFFGRRVSHVVSRRPKYLALALVLPILLVVPGLIVDGWFGGGRVSITPGVLAAAGVYFLSNLITSGTEELGWRAFLYPALRERNDLWRASLKGGLMWAVWHYPMVVLTGWDGGFQTLIGTLAGLTAAMIAMAYLTNFVYDRTHSVGLCMAMHALNNTMGYATGLIFPGARFAFLSAVAAWVAVAVMDARVNRRKAVSS